MRIQIRARHLVLSAELHEYISRRLHFALSRFANQIAEVMVRVEDVNGPRGGVDQRCSIDLAGRRLAPCRVEARDADLRVAVDRAARTAGRMVATELGRVRSPASRTGRAA